eukprot:gene4241-3025_t
MEGMSVSQKVKRVEKQLPSFIISHVRRHFSQWLESRLIDHLARHVHDVARADYAMSCNVAQPFRALLYEFLTQHRQGVRSLTDPGRRRAPMSTAIVAVTESNEMNELDDIFDPDVIFKNDQTPSSKERLNSKVEAELRTVTVILLRHEFAIMGPSVNLSARLMSKAGTNAILCDQETTTRDRTHPYQQLGEMQAKGYDSLVSTYRPLFACEGEDRSHFGRGLSFTSLSHLLHRGNSRSSLSSDIHGPPTNGGGLSLSHLLMSSLASQPSLLSSFFQSNRKVTTLLTADFMVTDEITTMVQESTTVSSEKTGPLSSIYGYRPLRGRHKEVETVMHFLFSEAGPDTVLVSVDTPTKLVTLLGLNGIGKSAIVSSIARKISVVARHDHNINVNVFRTRLNHVSASPRCIICKPIVLEIVRLAKKLMDTSAEAKASIRRGMALQVSARRVLVKADPRQEYTNVIETIFKLLPEKSQKFKDVVLDMLDVSMTSAKSVSHHSSTHAAAALAMTQYSLEEYKAAMVLLMNFSVSFSKKVLVVIIEDLQLLDTASMDIIKHVWLHGKGILLLTTTSSTLQTPQTHMGGASPHRATHSHGHSHKEIICYRLDRLEPIVQTILKAATVCALNGRSFTPNLIAFVIRRQIKNIHALVVNSDKTATASSSHSTSFHGGGGGGSPVPAIHTVAHDLQILRDVVSREMTTLFRRRDFIQKHGTQFLIPTEQSTIYALIIDEQREFFHGKVAQYYYERQHATRSTAAGYGSSSSSHGGGGNKTPLSDRSEAFLDTIKEMPPTEALAKLEDVLLFDGGLPLEDIVMLNHTYESDLECVYNIFGNDSASMLLAAELHLHMVDLYMHSMGAHEQVPIILSLLGIVLKLFMAIRLCITIETSHRGSFNADDDFFVTGYSKTVNTREIDRRYLARFLVNFLVVVLSYPSTSSTAMMVMSPDRIHTLVQLVRPVLESLPSRMHSHVAWGSISLMALLQDGKVTEAMQQWTTSSVLTSMAHVVEYMSSLGNEYSLMATTMLMHHVMERCRSASTSPTEETTAVATLVYTQCLERCTQQLTLWFEKASHCHHHYYHHLVMSLVPAMTSLVQWRRWDVLDQWFGILCDKFANQPVDMAPVAVAPALSLSGAPFWIYVRP